MDRTLQSRGDRSTGRRGAVAAALVVGVVVGGLWLLGAGLRMVGLHEVGPDAEEMAKDPVLHLHLDDATPDDIVTHTGSEGGVMPAMANRTSEAVRTWNTDAGHARSVLVAAVRGADAEGVVWSRLYCSGPSAIFEGHERLTVDGETIVADAEVRLDDTDLRISLSSGGADKTTGAPPSPSDPCPAELTALFAELID